MSAYRDTIIDRIVDAAQVDAETPVLCGVLHDARTVAQPGEWVVLEPWKGYAVWSDADFDAYHQEATTAQAVALAFTLRYGGRLRVRARRKIVEECAA